MDDGLIREIREAEQKASQLVSEAKQKVEAELEGIGNEYKRQKENWKAGFPNLLKKALSEADSHAAQVAEKKRTEARDRIVRMNGRF